MAVKKCGKFSYIFAPTRVSDGDDAPVQLVGMVGTSTKKKSPHLSMRASLPNNLAVTYSHMGIPHTTIGITAFHF